MAKQTVDLGTGPDTPGADNLYEAFIKVNANTDELYNKLEAGENQFNITIPDNTLDAIVIAKDVVYDYWQITESDNPPTIGDANWNNGPIDSTITLPDWNTHTYYLYVKNNEVVSQIGTEGVYVTPVDNIEPNITLTLTQNVTNPDTVIDWAITASDSQSGIDTSTLTLFNESNVSISIGASSGTISNQTPGSTRTFTAGVTDNATNYAASAAKSVTLAGAVGTNASIEFTIAEIPAYEVEESVVAGGTFNVSLTRTGDLNQTSTCTVSSRAWTTETAQVPAVVNAPISFGVGVATVNLAVTVNDTSSLLNTRFELYIDDGSLTNATIGPNNAILVHILGSGTTAGNGYQDFDAAGMRRLTLHSDMPEWTFTVGTDFGEEWDQLAIPSAIGGLTNSIRHALYKAGNYVGADPYLTGSVGSIPINLTQSGNWYIWALGYQNTNFNFSTYFAFDKNQVNTSQYAKLLATSASWVWRPVGTATGSVPTGYNIASGDHTFDIGTRESSHNLNWCAWEIVDDPTYTPSGFPGTISTIPSGEAATNDPDNPGTPIGPVTSSKITMTLSPLDNATDVQTNVPLVATYAGGSGILFNKDAITVTNAGGVASGSWSSDGVNTLTFRLDDGQSWVAGGEVEVTWTDVGSIIDTDGERKSIEDIAANAWDMTIVNNVTGDFVQLINFTSVVGVPRDVITPDILSTSSVGQFHSEDWAVNPNDAPSGCHPDGGLRFVTDPKSTGRGTVIEHYMPQDSGSWNFTGKTIQTKHHDIVHPSTAQPMREVYYAMDLLVMPGYISPSSVHLGAIYSSPDRSTHAGTVPTDITPDKCRVGPNFYGIASGYKPPNNTLALYVYHNRIDQSGGDYTTPIGWYGPYWCNVNDPTLYRATPGQPGHLLIPIDRWFTMEVYMKLNTFNGVVPRSDGVIQAWIDGVLCCNAQNQRLITVDNPLGLNMITHSMNYGGDQARAVQNDYVWRDNFRIAPFPITH